VSQLDLEYGHDHRADEGWRRVLGAVRAGIESIGLKEFAFRADERPQLVSDALAGRDRKHPKMEWLVRLVLAVPEYHRMAIVGELAGLIGCDLVKRRVLTPEEELRALKERVRLELGAVGERLISEVTR
jgi:hypothetical protein